MFTADFFRALRRRWYVAVVGVLLTAGLSAVALMQVPPHQQAEASMLLLPPASTTGDGGNPYLGLGGLNEVVDVLTRRLNSDAVREEIAAVAPTAEYETAKDDTTNGPVFTITVEDTTSEGALATLQLLIERVPTALGDLQSSVGVPEGALVTSMPLAIDEVTTPVTKTTLRAVIAAAAVGLLGTAFTVGLVDGLGRRRRLERERAGRASAKGTNKPAHAEDAGAVPVQDGPALFGGDSTDDTLPEDGRAIAVTAWPPVRSAADR